jgi:putative component of membrane protein insertase Oxa1/YidC/SpoIIIJ protein YidD/TM2 domain-containing membrane protein YozV
MRKIVIVIVFCGFCFGQNSLIVTSNWALTFYKRFISPLQGQNICNFTPTCSQFYRQSINKYGFFLGSVMDADRLLRCNPSAWTYLDKYYHGISNNRISDPIENHYIASPEANRQPLTAIKQPPTDNFKIAESGMRNAESELDFADYLFQSKDYVRAIGEYKRFYFANTNTQNISKEYAQLMIGECYLKTKEYNQALTYFNSGDNEYFAYGRARTYFEAGNYAKARDELNVLENSQFDKERIILTGVSYFRERNFMTGAKFFHNYSSDSLINRLSKYDGQGISRRNRLASSLFSAVIPGLGQVCSGRLGDGLYSFLTVIGSGLIADYYYHHDNSRIKFSIFTLLTAFFWSGNVYGANISARDYNEFQVRKYFQRIEGDLQEYNFAPNYWEIRK